MSTTSRSREYRKSPSLYLLGLLIVIDYATAIDYGAYRRNTLPQNRNRTAITTRDVLKELILKTDTPDPTLQDATEHLLPCGALLRTKILDVFGELVYDHYDDFDMREIEALYRIYRETLERKYNIFDIVPSVIEDPDTRATKICSHINEHVRTFLKESSTICMNIKNHDEPSIDDLVKLAVNATQKIYQSGLIEDNYPNGFTLQTVLQHLRAGRLRLTSSLIAGLLYNVEYDNFDDKIRSAERQLVHYLLLKTSGSKITKKFEKLLVSASTIGELLRVFLSNAEDLLFRDEKVADHAAYLSKHVVREIEAVSENIELLGTVYDNGTINLKYLFELILPNDVVDTDIIEARDFVVDELIESQIVERLMNIEKYEHTGPDQLLMDIVGKLRDLNYLDDIATSLYLHAHYWHKSHMIKNLNELLELFDAYENLRSVPHFSQLGSTIDWIKKNLRDSRNVTIEILCSKPRECLRLGLEIVASCDSVDDKIKRFIHWFVDRTSCGSSCLKKDNEHLGTDESETLDDLPTIVTTMVQSVVEAGTEKDPTVTNGSEDYNVNDISNVNVVGSVEDSEESSEEVQQNTPTPKDKTRKAIVVLSDSPDTSGETCTGPHCSEIPSVDLNNCEGANCEKNSTMTHCIGPDCPVINCEDGSCLENPVSAECPDCQSSSCEGDDCSESSAEDDCEGDNCPKNSEYTCEGPDCSKDSESEVTDCSGGECDARGNCTGKNCLHDEIHHICEGSDCLENVSLNVTGLADCKGPDCPIIQDQVQENCTGTDCLDEEGKTSCEGLECLIVEDQIVKDCKGADCPNEEGEKPCKGPECTNVEDQVDENCKGKNCSNEEGQKSCEGPDCPIVEDQIEEGCKGDGCPNEGAKKPCEGPDCPIVENQVDENCESEDCSYEEGKKSCEGPNCPIVEDQVEEDCRGEDCPNDGGIKPCEGPDCMIDEERIENECEGENCPDDGATKPCIGAKCLNVSGTTPASDTSDTFCDNSDPNYHRKLERLQKMRLLGVLSSKPPSSYAIADANFTDSTDDTIQSTTHEIKNKAGVPSRKTINADAGLGTKIDEEASSKGIKLNGQYIQSSVPNIELPGKFSFKLQTPEHTTKIQVDEENHLELDKPKKTQSKSGHNLMDIVQNAVFLPNGVAMQHPNLNREIEKSDTTNSPKTGMSSANSADGDTFEKSGSDVWTSLGIDKVVNASKDGVMFMKDTLMKLPPQNPGSIVTKTRFFNDGNESEDDSDYENEDSRLEERNSWGHQSAFARRQQKRRRPKVDVDSLEILDGNRKRVLRRRSKKRPTRLHLGTHADFSQSSGNRENYDSVKQNRRRPGLDVDSLESLSGVSKWVLQESTRKRPTRPHLGMHADFSKAPGNLEKYHWKKQKRRRPGLDLDSLESLEEARKRVSRKPTRKRPTHPHRRMHADFSKALGNQGIY